MAGRPANSPEILWSKVDRRGPEECWEWQGFRNPQGYGRTWINDRGYYAHRVIYNLVYPGRITLAGPKKKDALGFLRHKCDNPPCCNPRHLIVGTHEENMRDMVERGRQASYTSVGSPRAKLTAEDVFWIRLQKRHGATCKALAFLYVVSPSTIHGCLYGRHYQDI